jgi:hypothetical protein
VPDLRGKESTRLRSDGEGATWFDAAETVEDDRENIGRRTPPDFSISPITFDARRA